MTILFQVLFPVLVELWCGRSMLSLSLVPKLPSLCFRSWRGTLVRATWHCLHGPLEYVGTANLPIELEIKRIVFFFVEGKYYLDGILYLQKANVPLVFKWVIDSLPPILRSFFKGWFSCRAPYLLWTSEVVTYWTNEWPPPFLTWSYRYPVFKVNCRWHV